MTPSRPALPRRIKIGYGVADLGAALSYGTINTWLLYFLINIAGLSPFRAGLVFVLGRLFDALLDPVMGIFSDRRRNSWGRKPFIRWGAAPLGLAFAALWALASLPLAPGGRFALALLLFLLFSFLFTVVQVPYVALTPELAPDYDERTALSSYRVAFATFASLLAAAAPPWIVLAAARGGDLVTSPPGAWLALGLAFGLLTALPYLVMVATVPEPLRSADGNDGSAPIRLRTEVRSAFRAHGYPTIFALFVTVTVGVMVVSSMLPFYLESALRLEAARQPLVLGLLFGSAIAAFPLWTHLSTRWGKRATLVLSLLLLAGFTLLLVVASPGRSFALLLTLAALAGVSLSAVLLLPWAMLPDVVEFDELATGRRREGLLTALFTFGQKSAGSLGVFANALAAALFGYRPGVVEQAPATVAAIATMVGPVASGLFVLAALIAWRYPITRASHHEVRGALAERTAER
jgi:GPH family glycoside/pentoside/hexuronide:cation symporter